MAKILENPNGGRRTIRLSSDDIVMIITMYQQEFCGKQPTYEDIRRHLSSTPFYLPEEAI